MRVKPKNLQITPESESIRAAQSGDIRAFEEILLRYERPIFHYLTRILPTRQDAEDLTQETFLKLYKSLGFVEAERGVKSWLYTIATNSAYDWLRKRRRQTTAISLETAGEIAETNEETLSYQITERIANIADLEHALTKLKPVHTSVLLLYYREDMSYEEISQTLGIPLNTIKTHLHRARLELKSALEPDYGSAQNKNIKSA